MGLPLYLFFFCIVAVVADEVRGLALRAADAAKNISANPKTRMNSSNRIRLKQENEIRSDQVILFDEDEDFKDF